MSGVMDGVRVLEVSIFALVPAAAAVLADWGADVIKIEHPLHGDPLRGVAAWGVEPGAGGVTYLWEMCNRGKRSVAVDLANPQGRELVLSLAEQSDVFLTNFLAPARRKLGIDVDDIRARNPKIIYGRGTGQGPVGPDADKGGFDMISYWSRTGIASGGRPADYHGPVPMPAPAFGDVQTGMNLAGGIAAALFRRERTGEGAVVDTSLFASGLWAMQAGISGAASSGRDELPHVDRREPGNPLANHYRTRDDRFITLAFLASDRYWPGFCAAIGRPELETDARFHDATARLVNVRECVELLDTVFAEHTLAEWITILSRQEGQWSVLATTGDVLSDEQARANRYIQTVDYPGGTTLPLVSAPVQFDGTASELTPAPTMGAHTEEVLLEMGSDWDAILGLKEAEAIL